ncbi:DUF308 domain-containing protein [Promineifilum sp.]|uniref:DUF308 domain-containing protein n=1 Tax=Promineifilum sp. TaxID=2664178 RepID=UPI0035B4737B
MSNEVKSKLLDTAKSAAPWRKGIAWWVVLLEGVALLALGLAMFFAKQTTHHILGWIVAVALTVSGALSLYLSQKTTRRDEVRLWTMIHGGIGLAAGLLVILLLLFNSFLEGPGLTILGLGCLAYGGVGLYMLLDKQLVSLRRLSWASTLFYLAIGLLILLQGLGVGVLATKLQLVNLLIVVAGVIIIFWGLILRNEGAR